MNPYDHHDYGWNYGSKPTTPNKARSSKSAKSPFIKGPICLRWMAVAVSLRKPALAAGLALWFLRGVTRNDHGPFKINRSLRDRFQLTNAQMLRGLRALESANLVQFVKQGRGRCPVVAIVDLPPEPDVPDVKASAVDERWPTSGLARYDDRDMIEGQPPDEWWDSQDQPGDPEWPDAGLPRADDHNWPVDQTTDEWWDSQDQPGDPEWPDAGLPRADDHNWPVDQTTDERWDSFEGGDE